MKKPEGRKGGVGKKIVLAHLMIWYNIKKEEVIHVPNIPYYTDF